MGYGALKHDQDGCHQSGDQAPLKPAHHQVGPGHQPRVAPAVGPDDHSPSVPRRCRSP